MPLPKQIGTRGLNGTYLNEVSLELFVFGINRGLSTEGADFHVGNAKPTRPWPALKSGGMHPEWVLITRSERCLLPLSPISSEFSHPPNNNNNKAPPKLNSRALLFDYRVFPLKPRYFCGPAANIQDVAGCGTVVRGCGARGTPGTRRVQGSEKAVSRPSSPRPIERSRSQPPCRYSSLRISEANRSSV